MPVRYLPMHITRTAEHSLVVSQRPAEVLEQIRRAMDAKGFRDIEVDGDGLRIFGKYRGMTLFGYLDVAISPKDGQGSNVWISATAAADNLYALFIHPGERLIALVLDLLNVNP